MEIKANTACPYGSGRNLSVHFDCLDAPQAADRLMTAFEKSFEQLQNHPFSFPRADDESLRKKGYRKLIVENYVGAYLLNEQTKEVVVMRFFYGARDYKRLL